jgi:MarR family transcriptional regulator, transcriptional regulator for hemolysin
MGSADVPVTLLVSSSAKALTRAFDDALAAAGGSVPTWLVLLALTEHEHRTQGDLAAAVGVRQPTLTHHLDAMEGAGFVTRVRDAGNRRSQRVVVTDAGRTLFLRLRRAAGAFDGRVRAGLDDDEIAALRRVLAQLVENAQAD